MNFIKRIKRNLDDHRNCYGPRDKCTVDRIALKMLIEDYEKLDSEARVRFTSDGSDKNFLERKLEAIVTALYHQSHKNNSDVMFLVTETLRPLILEENKRKATENYYPMRRTNFKKLI